jgi:hypothetical protein
MRFIRLLLPSDRHEAFHGDVQEEYLRRVSMAGKRRASLWYWKEVALMAFHSTWRWALLGITAGAIVGWACYSLGVVATEGPVAVLLFPVAVLVTIALFRWRPPETSFLRFLTSFTLLITALLVLYVAIYRLPRIHPIPLLGHAWRLAFMLAVSTAVAACAALMARAPTRSTYSVPLALALLGFGAMFTARFRLSLAILAVVVIATAVFLHSQRVEPFARRFLIVVGVNALVAGLACGFFFLTAPGWVAARAWAPLFQNGWLYAEIGLASLVSATLTRTREADGDELTAASSGTS